MLYLAYKLYRYLARGSHTNPQMKKNLERLKELTDSLTDRDFMLKRKNEALDGLLATSPVPVLFWMTDLDLRFFSNGGEIPGLKVEETDMYMGKTVYDYFETDDKTYKPIAEINKALSGETVTYMLNHKSRMLWTSCSPMYDYNNKIIGTIGVTWDLTLVCNILDLFSNMIAQKDSIPEELYSKILTYYETIKSECQLNIKV